MARDNVWPGIADSLVDTPPESIGGLWRALNYLACAQLYLRDNVLLDRALSARDVKPQPRGHWGVCAPVNLVLALVAPLQRAAPDRVSVLHGAGHAGPSALAYSYLTGRLGSRLPAFARGSVGIRKLITEFPHDDGLGGEITALIPDQQYMGGQLGPSLSVAAGLTLDNPLHLAIPLIGDGECETGTLAAAWLGQRALHTGDDHGAVLPVVLLNGQRMGGPSLLAQLTTGEQDAYFAGHGYQPIRIDGRSMAYARDAFATAVRSLRPIGDFTTPQPLILVTVAKGATGPDTIGGRRIMGTPAVHKCPLTDPSQNPEELNALRRWLNSYKPGELFTAAGWPQPHIASILPSERPSTAIPCRSAEPLRLTTIDPSNFGTAVAATLQHWAASARRFRVFSPDELASNRIPPGIGSSDTLAPIEVLSEELCHSWLQGYLESGGNGVFISYEAFATINSSVLVQHLLHRALSPHRTRSMNYLLTSLGWRNCYTHQNPGLMSSLVETGSPDVRVYTPADPRRVAAVLDRMLRSHRLTNLVIADKHAQEQYQTVTLADELAHGAAMWPVDSDSEPDLVMAACGDLATRQALAAAEVLRGDRKAIRVRFVQIGEITALGDPAGRPHAMSDDSFHELFPPGIPVLLTTPGYAGALRNLLWTRPGAARFTITGFTHPPHALSHPAILKHADMDAPSLAATAYRLLDNRTADACPRLLIPDRGDT